jgi:hypothetical protein
MTTPTGLRFPGEVPFEAWERAGERISRMVNSAAWYLGDWLVYGQERYDDRYRRVIATMGLDYQTLRNYAWVARSVNYERRRSDLSFQHHAEVASLDPAGQSHWLELAARHGWSRNQLRRNLREGREDAGAAGRYLLPKVNADAGAVERWRRAAAESHTEFAAWIVTALDRAAESVLPRREQP